MTLKPFLIHLAYILAALLLTESELAAEENSRKSPDVAGFSVGLISSPKGFGPSVEFNAGKFLVCNAYIVVDTYDMIFKEASKPGVRTSFCFNANLQQWEMPFCDIELFAGPGIYAGYGFDSNRSKGFYCALSADGGVRFKLMPDITVILSIEIGCGLHLSKDNSQQFNKLHMYKYGIYNSWIPQVSILYRF